MFYVIDEKGNKKEAYDKEGVLALLEQAIEDGDLTNIASDSAFVDKLKCCVTGGTNKVAFVTQAKYNELEANGQLQLNTMYYITDDTTSDDINDALEQLTNDVIALQEGNTDLTTRVATLEDNAYKATILESTPTYFTPTNVIFLDNSLKGETLNFIMNDVDAGLTVVQRNYILTIPKTAYIATSTLHYQPATSIGGNACYSYLQIDTRDMTVVLYARSESETAFTLQTSMGATKYYKIHKIVE